MRGWYRRASSLTLPFALVNAIVLRPLSCPQADRLPRIFDTNPAATSIGRLVAGDPAASGRR